MRHDRPASHRIISGWPALLVICALIAGVLYLTIGRSDPAARLKPATGTARAMALAAEAHAARSDEPRNARGDRETPVTR